MPYSNIVAIFQTGAFHLFLLPILLQHLHRFHLVSAPHHQVHRNWRHNSSASRQQLSATALPNDGPR